MINEEAQRLRNTAVYLTADGRRDAALILYRRAYAIDPENQWDALIIELIARYLTDEANEVMSRVDTSGFTSTDLAQWRSLNAFIDLANGDPEHALKNISTAAKFSTNYAFDYACMTLQSGDFEKGWQLYECRDNGKMGWPAWHGERVPKLLVMAEQGLGDTIQFARYIPWLSTRVGKVIFAVQTELVGLFSLYNSGAEVVPKGSQVVANASMHLLSAPLFHKTTLKTMLPPAVVKVRDYHLPGDKLKVGIVWSGSTANKQNVRRSMPFIDLLPLAENPDVQLYSLQCGPRSVDIAAAGAQSLVIDLSGECYSDWVTTAAIINKLDCVVSVCTSVAHLAGSLGKPCVTLLSKVSDWRWLLRTKESPWYPKMLLARQTKPNDWSGPVQEAAHFLKELSNAH